jgi:hypothetical protein
MLLKPFSTSFCASAGMVLVHLEGRAAQVAVDVAAQVEGVPGLRLGTQVTTT